MGSLLQQMQDTGRAMDQTGLSPGRSGNFSVRTDRGMLITPTGKAYGSLQVTDIVEVDRDGSSPPEQPVPSSESRMHLSIYAARPDCSAIVHTHSLHATALACLRRSIPAFHYMVAAFGGARIACAPYATYGSLALARHAVNALGPRHACLLANHGAIALGRSLAEAFERAEVLEALAAQYITALQAGRPRILSAKDMKIVLEKFQTYGSQDKQGSS